MANTTNFGWETPDDTDLVKDGAAAIRTLGSAIDTSLADLEGGTTGQILAKNSNTDMDFIWVTNDVGDITEVVAGTGISGGGTSGSVTITNTVATEFDAKGDLVVGTGADTFDKLSAGTNDHRLVAASGETTGLKYVADTQNTVIDAAGDLLYGTAADTIARLGIGTAGQVLKVNSGATAPEWGTVGGGGKVLQVVQATNSTSQTITSSSYVASNLTASITPSSATSKILVLVSEPILIARVGAVASGSSRLMRGATAIRECVDVMDIDATGATYVGSAHSNGQMYLDDPATTSSTTYKMEYKTTSAATTSIYLGISGGLKSIILLEIGA